MRKETDRIVQFLKNPTQTAVHVVTLSASMSCQEAVQLADALRHRAQVPLGLLICNRVPVTPPEGVIPAGEPEWSGFLTAEVERARAQHERLQATAIETQLERIDCPEFPGAGRAVVAHLAEHFRALR